MKVVIAMDSWKGSLTAAEACRIAAGGIAAACPAADIRERPMSDGGEGMAAVLLEALGGEWVQCRVSGPLPGRRVAAGYGWIPRKATAVMEMAAAAGLTLLAEEERDPLRTGTRGVGEMVGDACRRGARRILLGVGGSATVDGGTGAARALGWRFFDRTGRPVGRGGGDLEIIERIVAPQRLDLPALEVLCDVTNPLLGEIGAARVFGPQKGAGPAAVEKLEKGLANLAELVKRDIGKDIGTISGGGAAGGLAAGAAAFLRARLIPGIEKVMDVCEFDREVQSASWVVTGEGSLDRQSLDGKVIDGVTRRSRRAGCRVAVLAGRVELDGDTSRRRGLDYTRAVASPEMPLEEAMERSEELLHAAAREFGSLLL